MVGQLLEIVKTALKISLVSKQDKNNTHPTKQTQKHPKQTTPTQKPTTARQNNQGDL